MAENKDTQQSFGDFSTGLSWDLNELMFRVRATGATLRDSPAYDEGEMVGISYLLQGIENDLERLAIGVSNAEYDYVREEASNG